MSQERTGKWLILSYLLHSFQQNSYPSSVTLVNHLRLSLDNTCPPAIFLKNLESDVSWVWPSRKFGCPKKSKVALPKIQFTCYQMATKLNLRARPHTVIQAFLNLLSSGRCKNRDLRQTLGLGITLQANTNMEMDLHRLFLPNSPWEACISSRFSWVF